jgi:hypothetical protein
MEIDCQYEDCERPAALDVCDDRGVFVYPVQAPSPQKRKARDAAAAMKAIKDGGDPIHVGFDRGRLLPPMNS